MTTLPQAPTPNAVTAGLPPVIMLFGATASGKSALALRLAAALGAEIINADSRQIYKGFPILNACPSPADYAAVPHHLYEFLPVTTRFSASSYTQMATQAIEDIISRGKVPLLVGGTGFYLQALEGGLSPMPTSNPVLEAEVAAMAPAARHAALAAADPLAAARLPMNDTQRVVRALTIYKQTGQTLTAWQQGGAAAQAVAAPPIAPRWRYIKVGLNPPRAVLHENLRKRWHNSAHTTGALNEAKELIKLGFNGEEPGLKGLAIPLWMQHARTGKPDLGAVTQKALEADRQYAKRQCTWLNNSFAADVILENPTADEAVGQVLMALA